MDAHNLPAQLTPFIGRVEELGEIAALLSDPACRLLTLVGPGGIGKTRLALEAARQSVGEGFVQPPGVANPRLDEKPSPLKGLVKHDHSRANSLTSIHASRTIHDAAYFIPL